MNEPPDKRVRRLEPLKRLGPWSPRQRRVAAVVGGIALATLWFSSLINMVGLVFFDRVLIPIVRWRWWGPIQARRMPGDRLSAALMLLLLTTAIVAFIFFTIRAARRRGRRQDPAA